MFRLISQNWNVEIIAACRSRSSSLRIICPFIKKGALSRLLGASRYQTIEIITRFDLNCFNQGVSDLDSLGIILDAGGQARGVKHLHSKLYLFGSDTVIATSANVTDAAFRRNHEFGFIASDPRVVATCNAYFDDLWRRAGTNLTRSQLARWTKRLNSHQRKGYGRTRDDQLPDHGTAVGESPFTVGGGEVPTDNPAFIKFFGTADNRVPRTTVVADLVAESGCNWACTYPESKPPRQVSDGDIIYMARLVDDDILVFGKAIGRRHRDDEDRASAGDIKARPWKADWPRYVRVHDAQFIDATLGDGISFYEMMSAMGPDSFDSTRRNKQKRSGNINPFESYNRKAHMMLTARSRNWIESRLNDALQRYGEVDLTAERYRPPKSKPGAR